MVNFETHPSFCMKRLFFAIGLLFSLPVFSQPVSAALEKSWQQFMKDEQLRHGIASLYVINAKTGAVVFNKNAETGLAPASTQKIITSVTALDILGQDFRYKTEIGYSGKVIDGKLEGDIYTTGSGDPTFGSWRWKETGIDEIYQSVIKALKKEGIRDIQGKLWTISKGFESQQIPDGWIWQDIGNYYGAGAGSLVWHENQYDLILRSGKAIGDQVEVVRTDPVLFAQQIQSELTSAAKGTGDNAYIYLPVGNNTGIVRGTIPVNENSFRISGSMHDPSSEYVNGLKAAIAKDKINIRSEIGFKTIEEMQNDSYKILYDHFSLSLDSIIFWFNRKSINLYGEALVKTLGYQQRNWGATDTGIAVIREFWKNKGLDEESLNMRDGSGLSPLNRVTTHAQVDILKYAKGREWFPSFYHALPEYNGMKMKSGTISDVKGFCGYHQAKDGTEYIFSFLVNNYSGKSSALVGKMYKVLDNLK